MTTPDTDIKKPAEVSLAMTGAVLLVLSALGGGAGWFLGMSAGDRMPEPEAVTSQTAASYTELDKAEEELKAEEEANRERLEQADAAPQIVPLSPITTNLSFPSDSWVRLEIALVFEGEADLNMAETIHQDLLSYMRTVSLQQIEGARGFQHLRDDLSERATIRSEGRVTDLLFRTFLIE
ncbi:MAG: flagellar basal body-associated FliL family protein [Alphaproteobacteria bacterium]|nr:flagellar basal body-associated FliL family protein [Alphaproteobacteria bacterium]